MLKFLTGILFATVTITILYNAQAQAVEPDINSMLRTVVLIEGYDDKGERQSKGSGVVLDNGYIASVDHVFAGAPDAKFKGTLSDGTTFELKTIKALKEKDLILLQPSIVLTHSTNFTCAPVVVGQPIIAIGNPTFLNFITTFGRVSSLRQVGKEPLPKESDIFTVDAPLAPGMSGGPVFDIYGKVLGLNDAILTAPLGGDGAKNIPPTPSLTGISIIVSGEAVCDLMKDLNV
jgi:serine protease Do